MERRKEKDPLHAPDEPEMDKGLDQERSGRNPATEPPKDRP